ncbi:MAG: hypothetical protein Q9187_004506 [Circinaria calcarea]
MPPSYNISSSSYGFDAMSSPSDPEAADIVNASFTDINKELRAKLDVAMKAWEEGDAWRQNPKISQVHWLARVRKVRMATTFPYLITLARKFSLSLTVEEITERGWLKQKSDHIHELERVKDSPVDQTERNISSIRFGPYKGKVFAIYNREEIFRGIQREEVDNHTFELLYLWYLMCQHREEIGQAMSAFANTVSTPGSQWISVEPSRELSPVDTSRISGESEDSDESEEE